MPGSMKGMISDAFMALCLKKDIDKITVKDIVEECGISRQTFYYHFQDLLDVVEWTMDCSVKNALAASMKEDTLEGALEVFIAMAAEKHDVIYRLMQSQRREHIEKIFGVCMAEYLKGLLQKQMGDRAISTEDMEVAKRFYACAVVGVMLEYCGQKDLDVKKLSHQLAQLLRKI